MADRAKKITELASLIAPANSDLLVIVSNPSTAAITKSITVGNLGAYITIPQANISSLPSITSTNSGDILAVQQDPDSSSRALKKITVGNFTAGFARTNSNTTFLDDANVSINNLIIRRKATPANSSVDVTGGSVFYDDNYIYVAVSNNHLKRVALESF
jgi:hypothetical protein